ncbi:UNKNOWN [Stylonychia lemnae]|uniref:Uncharacterized protein n=1 Tax=Stylonychia lemnae TaxID=5949 RepID=A0A077ZSP2_STYLE|nr:UNKNOWN [Stylonychia lemnae]|eukprot:CDW72892.1 UNKNOWN [Stylonychia lemnae]
MITQKNCHNLKETKNSDHISNVNTDENKLLTLNSHGSEKQGNYTYILNGEKFKTYPLSIVHLTKKLDEFSATSSLQYNKKQEDIQLHQSFRIDSNLQNDPLLQISTKYQDLESFSKTNKFYQNIKKLEPLMKTFKKSRNHSFNLSQSLSNFKITGQSPLYYKSDNIESINQKCDNRETKINSYEQHVNSLKMISNLRKQQNLSFEAIHHSKVQKCELPTVGQTNCKKLKLKNRMIKFNSLLNSSLERTVQLPQIKIISQQIHLKKKTKSSQNIKNYNSTASNSLEDINSNCQEFDKNFTFNLCNQQELLKETDKFCEDNIFEGIAFKDLLSHSEVHSISLSPDNRAQFYPKISAIITKKKENKVMRKK